MLTILSAGIAPGLALLSFFYLKDHITEPITLIIRTFIFGCLLVFPIMFIQYAFSTDGIENYFIQSFFIVSLSEEFFKWFIFLYVIYHHTEFDAHYDGIVYAVSISLGFATVENILYLLNNGIEYAFSRALFPVSSHALFGVIMGYHFGKAKTTNRFVKWNIFLALLLPLFLHGTYNYILKGIPNNWIFLIVPFMIVLWFIGLRRVRSAHQLQLDPLLPMNKKNA
ncbi:glutamic-type intramembrane protease PrsW [Ornithinibacillus salinisoli]|uniref:Protease PrsW n=1 Tax=Ornithinibacillus salinisoli TaxID=1848459 RepID=A0ABW4W3G0_9BACI